MLICGHCGRWLSSADIRCPGCQRLTGVGRRAANAAPSPSLHTHAEQESAASCAPDGKAKP